MTDFPLQQPFSGATSTQPGPGLRRPGLMTVLLGYWVVFILLQLISQALSTRDGVTLWGFPAALSVALLLVHGPKVLPAIILAPLPVALTFHPMGMGPLAILAMSTSYACGHALAVLAFRRLQLSSRLRRPQDVAGFLALAVLGPLMASLPMLLLLRASGSFQDIGLVQAIRVLFLSDALGVLTLGPLLLLWIRPLLSLGWTPSSPCPPTLRTRAFLLQVVALAVTAFVVVRFSDPGTLHLKYLLFLPMTWMVVSGGLGLASLGFSLLGLLLTALILQVNHAPDALLGIQAFLCLLFGTALFQGSATDAQREAIRIRDRRSLHLNQLMDATGAIPWEMNLETGQCTYLGHAVESLLGGSPEVWRQKPFWGEVIHPEDQLAFLRFLLEAARPGQVQQIEFRLRDIEGGHHWVRATGGLESGQSRVMGFLFDIHAHKRAEEHAFQARLQEKDLLLREIHHRVKNNLQVVSSLLRLQASTSEDPALQRALKEAQERVQAIALIHQKLKHAPDFSQVDLPDYVRTLADRLVRSYASAPALIDLQVKVAHVDIGPDAPVPLGLILNELVANALTHAFPPGTGGSLNIDIGQDTKGSITLRVADSGQGLPGSVDLDHGGLGFQLVRALTDQLGGSLKLERHPGTSFLLTFPPTRHP